MTMRVSSSSATAVVVGGGIIGLMSALELVRAGFAVTVLERGQFAGQSSWAGGGLLSPLYPWKVPEAVWSLSAASMAAYPGLCEALLEATGIDPEWTPSGLMMLDADEVTAGLAWAAHSKMAVEVRAIQKNTADAEAALYLPWVAQVRNPRLCRSLVLYLRHLGGKLFDHVGDIRIKVQGGRALAESAETIWDADVLVVCAGAWTANVLQAVDWRLPIYPVKGQMLLLRGEPAQLPSLLLQQGRYLIPRRDGRVLVGSTVEEAGFDTETTQHALVALRDFANTLCPECENMPIEAQWAGLRPGSPDGIPTIAQHPLISNLYVNAGHHRYGLTMAPASAAQLRRLVTA